MGVQEGAGVGVQEGGGASAGCYLLPLAAAFSDAAMILLLNRKSRGRASQGILACVQDIAQPALPSLQVHHRGTAVAGAAGARRGPCR